MILALKGVGAKQELLRAEDRSVVQTLILSIYTVVCVG